MEIILYIMIGVIFVIGVVSFFYILFKAKEICKSDKQSQIIKLPKLGLEMKTSSAIFLLVISVGIMFADAVIFYNLVFNEKDKEIANLQNKTLSQDQLEKFLTDLQNAKMCDKYKITSKLQILDKDGKQILIDNEKRFERNITIKYKPKNSTPNIDAHDSSLTIIDVPNWYIENCEDIIYEYTDEEKKQHANYSISFKDKKTIINKDKKEINTQAITFNLQNRN